MTSKAQEPAAAGDGKETLSRREFLAGAAAISVTMLMPGYLCAAPAGARTFTILHTNDMHASFIKMYPDAAA